MASKGKKFRRYTDEERTEIVTKYLSGKHHTYEDILYLVNLLIDNK